MMVVKHVVNQCYKHAGNWTKMEERGCFYLSNPDDTKRGDSSINNPSKLLSSKEKLILDVSITGPLKDASKGVLAPITLKVAENTGKSANKRFNEKKKEYAERADANRFGFLPIILKSNGLMHPKSKEFFYKLAKDCSETKRIDICILYKYYLKRFSVCLQRIYRGVD